MDQVELYPSFYLLTKSGQYEKGVSQHLFLTDMKSQARYDSDITSNYDGGPEILDLTSNSEIKIQSVNQPSDVFVFILLTIWLDVGWEITRYFLWWHHGLEIYLWEYATQVCLS